MIQGWEGGDAEAWAEVLGVPRLELHAEVDSTNTRLRALAAEVAGGVLPFTTVVAHAQRGGRGRDGRGWRSDAGAGLWLSILLPLPPGGPPGVATLAVGVAVAEAVERLGGSAASGRHAWGDRASGQGGGAGAGAGGGKGADAGGDPAGDRAGSVRLKWPNDVMAISSDGTVAGKLAGILCEVASAGKGGGAGGIVAGIGVNLRPIPDGSLKDGMFPPADLETLLGRRVAPPELARHLVQELRRLADPPPARLGGGLRSAWEARDLLAGTLVQVTPGPRGVVRGVGDDGALLVEVDAGPGGMIPVRAGRVRWI